AHSVCRRLNNGTRSVPTTLEDFATGRARQVVIPTRGQPQPGTYFPIDRSRRYGRVPRQLAFGAFGRLARRVLLTHSFSTGPAKRQRSRGWNRRGLWSAAGTASHEHRPVASCVRGGADEPLPIAWPATGRLCFTSRLPSTTRRLPSRSRRTHRPRGSSNG